MFRVLQTYTGATLKIILFCSASDNTVHPDLRGGYLAFTLQVVYRKFFLLLKKASLSTLQIYEGYSLSVLTFIFKTGLLICLFFYLTADNYFLLKLCLSFGLNFFTDLT